MGNWNLGYTFLQSSPRHFRVSSCLVTRQLPFSPFHHFPVNSVSTSTPINLRSPKKREQTNAQIRRNNEVLQKNASSPIARTRRSHRPSRRLETNESPKFSPGRRLVAPSILLARTQARQIRITSSMITKFRTL